MASDALSAFIRTAFRSVWALELLLHLKNSERSWSHEELVAALRGSSLIVRQSLDTLIRAGLVSIDDAGGARFLAANESLAGLVGETEALYRRRPDAVRRIILTGTHPGLATFADAFRLRRERE